MILTRWMTAGVACGFAFVTACREAEPPRSSDDIFQERIALPALFLTVKSHKQVIAPGNKGVFIDPSTSELCWLALACHNPRCPGLKGDNHSYIFIAPDPGMFIRKNGSIGYDLTRAKATKLRGSPKDCPKCLEIRDLKKESQTDGERYASFVRPHLLQDTAMRLQELEAESKKRIEWMKRQKK